MKKNRNKFFIGLTVALIVLASSIVGGYFMIDKVLVPKYFSTYGINSLSELVRIVETIYIVPDEEEFIDNPFTKSDASSATKKLITAGFPYLKDNTIDYELIGSGEFTLTPEEEFTDNYILLTDKEVASIAEDIVSSGILVSNFPDLSYINTLNMTVKQLSITPTEPKKTTEPQAEEDMEESDTLFTSTDASIILTIKLDTESARKQISTNLNMPLFLVDWIIPDIIYVTTSLYTKIDETTGERIYTDAKLSINSKTAKQSEVLLNLLISFIFPEGSISIEELANQLGTLAINGISLLGNMEFAKIKSATGTPLNGIKVHLK